MPCAIVNGQLSDVSEAVVPLSFFYVLEGRLFTPPLTDLVMDSITRRHVLELTGASERTASRLELQHLEEAFLAATWREIQPVHAIDRRRLDRVRGPMTSDASRALQERIARSLAAMPACDTGSSTNVLAR